MNTLCCYLFLGFLFSYLQSDLICFHSLVLSSNNDGLGVLTLVLPVFRVPCLSGCGDHRLEYACPPSDKSIDSCKVEWPLHSPPTMWQPQTTQNNSFRANKTVQWVKALKRRKLVAEMCPLTSTFTPWQAHTHTFIIHTYAIIIMITIK